MRSRRRTPHLIPTRSSPRSTPPPASWAGHADDAGVEAWSRGLTLGDQRLDVRRMLEHALHDSTHHLADVERGFARLRAEPGG
jgi:hypothetical protein